jgi:tetratricopeptide (TPR) repeat protein
VIREVTMKAIYVLAVMAVMLTFSCGMKSETEAEALPDFHALWDFDDPAGTEYRFKSLIPQAKESGDANYYCELLTQIARSQGLQGKFGEAHATLDAAYAAMRDESSVAMVRYLLERGRVYNSSGDPGVARGYFLKAFDLADNIDADFYAVDALHMLGIVDPPEKQMDWNVRALEIAERSEDERARKWRGSLYNNMGWTYHDMGEYENALRMFEKSLAFREEADDSAGVLIAKWAVARANRSLGNVEEALKMQVELEKNVEQYGLPPDGYVYEEIAECLLLLGREQESARYFGLAYEILSRDDYMVANEPGRLDRLKSLSLENL